MKYTSILFSSLVLASCAVSQFATPGQSDVDRVATKYPGYTLAELNQGRTIYEQNCGGCHALKNPTSEPESEWNRIVPDMTKKVNKKAGKEAINAHDQEVLLKYLITMSTAPKTK